MYKPKQLKLNFVQLILTKNTYERAVWSMKSSRLDNELRTFRGYSSHTDISKMSYNFLYVNLNFCTKARVSFEHKKV